MQVVKYGFDYHDDWNYRRLLELVLDLVPVLKEDVLFLNAGTDSQYLLDVMNDSAIRSSLFSMANKTEKCPKHSGAERFAPQSGHTGLSRIEVRPCICSANWKLAVL